MSDINNKFKIFLFPLLLVVSLFFTSQLLFASDIRTNSLTNEVYQSDCPTKYRCKYVALNRSASNLRKDTIETLDNNASGGYFRLSNLLSTKIEIDSSDSNTVVFTSRDSQDPNKLAKCVDPRHGAESGKMISCMDVIDYLLRLYDKPELARGGNNSFSVKFVFYEYDATASKGFNFGFSGFSDQSSGGSETKPARASVNSSGDSQSFVLNAGNRLADLLSLRLNLGQLGEYVESIFSLETTMQNGQQLWNEKFGTRQFYLNSSNFSGGITSEMAGFRYSGKVERVSGQNGQSLLRISNFNYYYAVPTQDTSSSNSAISLVNVIESGGSIPWSTTIEPGRPFKLFEMNASEFSKIRNTALAGIKRNKASKASSVIGVLYIEELTNSFGEDDTSDRLASVANFDFARLFNDATIRYESKLLDTVPLNLRSDPSTKVIENNQKNYLLSSYFFKLNESDLDPGMEHTYVELSIVDGGPVEMIGGVQKLKLGQLAKKGTHIGIKLKDKLDIRELKFKLKIRLSRFYYDKESLWTDLSQIERDSSGKVTKGPTNMYIYHIKHNLTNGRNGLSASERYGFIEKF